MTTPSRDPSVFNEPHLRENRFEADASESKARRTLEQTRQADQREDERIEHTVWDEPSLSDELGSTAGEREDTYANWLKRRREQTTATRSWLVTAGLILLSGPWALVGAFLAVGVAPEMAATQLMMIVVLGPLTEELMKIAAALYVVEKRPFLFRSPLQIMMAVLAGGLVFAVVENLLYQYVYIREPSPELIHWRWTVCILLHVGCSCIAGLGLVRIWRGVWREGKRPVLARAYPYILAAVLVHGVYNVFAVLMSMTKYHV